MKGVKGKELILTTENKVGKLEEIARAIKDEGINLRAISAWSFEDKAFFRIVSSDNVKTKEILQLLGKVEEKEVIIVEMTDEMGQLFSLASKLKDNNIDINHIYGTASEPDKSVIVVFSSANNNKALELISS
ncbi:MAG: hypothetical protein PHU64_03525 [Candidatus Omnitrophica bacterium]|jgi:hypothetical protein|nr:hypothetical protein [Candidatus Omnitrophota bacterium]MDD5430576.1 hypothetical protein [Candidatus Omnitrophota bacterium]